MCVCTYIQVLHDLHAEHTTVSLDEQGTLVGTAGGQDLAKPLQEQCRRVALTCNELLRHFWACLPLNTHPRQDKAKRLDRALQAQYDRCSTQNCGLEYYHMAMSSHNIMYKAQEIIEKYTPLGVITRAPRFGSSSGLLPYDSKQREWTWAKVRGGQALPYTRHMSGVADCAFCLTCAFGCC